MSGNLIQGNAIQIPLKDESVQLCCFSPPYWGLRFYKIKPLVFDGESGCVHEWGDEISSDTRPIGAGYGGDVCGDYKKHDTPKPHIKISQGRFCQKCNAWCGQLGLEPTIDLFLDHMMLVMGEVWRILRNDGICFCNIGDSYWNPRGSCGRGNKIDNPNIKPKSLCLIPQKFAIRCQEAGWVVRSEIIWHKCLSGGTILYAQTQKGEMPSMVKDLVRLKPDTVKLWNGERWTQVLSWSRRKYPRAKYEIVLRNGQRIGCTANHRWETARGLLKTNRLERGDILSRCVLPQPINPVIPQHLPDEIGWFVGLFLAEGSFGKDGTVLQIASHVKEIERFEKLKVIASKYGGFCQRHELDGKACTMNIYGPMLHAIIKLYLNGKNAKGKHLSPACWKRSNKFLEHVLQGYLEGDGHKRKNEWRLGFTQNDNWSADLRTLGARLNLSVRLKRTVHKCNGKEHPGWTGSIRKHEHRRTQDTQVMEIVKSRARQFWDIQVEDKPHLFALASGLLTHNSNPMPESCQDRPTRTHEQIWMLTKQGRYFWDQEAVAQPQAEYERARRLREKKQGHKAVYALRSDGKTGQVPQSASGACRNVQARHESAEKGTRNIRTVWTLTSEPSKDRAETSCLAYVPRNVVSCGMKHIVSPYCLVHEDLFVRVAREFCDEPVSSWLNHIIRICSHLFQEQLNDSDPFEKNHILKILQRSLDCFCQNNSQIAIDHSKQIHKKVLFLLTNPSYSSFVEILSHTEYKPELLFYFVLYSSICGSNIFPDVLNEYENFLAQIPFRIVDKSALPISPKCLCSFYTIKTEKTNHFATWPSKLVEIMIRAGSSPRVCEICGAPWEWVTKKIFVPQEDVSLEKGIRCGPGQKPLDETDNRSGFPPGANQTKTAGWKPACKCDCKGLGKCMVADIFCGVGTTVLVAEKLGRIGIGLDLSNEYLWDIAKGKIEAPMQKELF